MEGQSENAKTFGCLSRLSTGVMGCLKKLKKIGSDDPRRIIHSFKVGLGITLVSTFYYINPLFKDVGVSAIWAVLTVVLVMEFTVGAAISKGLNRTCATFLAGTLGVGAHYLAILFGEKGEMVVLGLSVFLIAGVATYARFIPELKARFDYGVTIFILTFCMVTVSSYRQAKIVILAKERLFTIAIGVVISFFTSILVFPIWAGDDLHKQVAGNLEKLASFLQDFGEVLDGKKSSVQCHKSVLSSKSSEDTLANFTRWEPGHGRFGFRHPWDQYLKIGTKSRQCAYLMEALNAYMSSYQVVFDKSLQVVFVGLCFEEGKALREVATAMHSMTTIPVAGANHHFKDQVTCLLSEKCGDCKEMVLHVATVVSLLMEIIGSTKEIVASVEELGRLAHFRSCEVARKAAVKPVAEVEVAHISITVEE